MGATPKCNNVDDTKLVMIRTGIKRVIDNEKAKQDHIDEMKMQALKQAPKEKFAMYLFIFLFFIGLIVFGYVFYVESEKKAAEKEEKKAAKEEEKKQKHRERRKKKKIRHPRPETIDSQI